MNRIFAVATALAVCGWAHARPLIVEESSQIPNPDSSYDSFGSGVALDGEFAVVLGFKTIPDPEGFDDTLRTAFLFRRVDGAWTFVRALASTLESNEGDGPPAVGVDMANGFALLGLQPLQVWERIGADYVFRQQFTGDTRTAHMQIDGNRFILGGDCWGAGIFARDASGTWQREGRADGYFCGSTDSATGGPASLNGSWAVVSNPWGYDANFDPLPGGALTLARFMGGGGTDQWTQTQAIHVDPEHAVGHVALWGEDLFVEDYEQYGTAVYQYDGAGQWHPSFRRLLSGGEAMLRKAFGSPYGHDGSVEASAVYVMRHTFDPDRGTEVVQVFQFGLNDYDHVATLVPGDGGRLTGQIAINGRHVLLAGQGKAYYFELPETLATPALLEHTFPNTTAAGWTAQPGSQFSVVQRSDSRVFRQASMAGEAGASLDAANWTNQAIQADVKPWNVDGTDRWVGLVTRRADAANYYYVTLRGSGTLQLKRMVQGSFRTLASAPVPFALSRHYRLRLESMGSLHRVYLDGVKLLEARDDALAQGRPGLLSYKAAVDYDNVVVSPAPQLTIFRQETNDSCIPECQFKPFWTYNGGRWEGSADGRQVVLAQTSTSDWSRAFAGQRTDDPDMSVQVRARLRAFGAGSDPWFGVMARVDEDASSYTYLALRRSNTVTLRRVNHGVVTQLGAAVFNVSPGRWYRLRLEAIGNRLRGYIDNQLVLEAVDSQAWTGAGGLVTYHTSADYSDYEAVRP